VKGENFVFFSLMEAPIFYYKVKTPYFFTVCIDLFLRASEIKGDLQQNVIVAIRQYICL
jgi:hypothetical protein